MRCLWRGSEWKVMILEGRPVGGEQRKGQRQWTNSTVSVEPVQTPWRVIWSRAQESWVSVKVLSRLRKAKSARWQRVAKPGEALPRASVTESRDGLGSCMYICDRNTEGWKQEIMWLYLAFHLFRLGSQAFHLNKVGFVLWSPPASGSRRPDFCRERAVQLHGRGSHGDLQAWALQFRSWRI